MASEGDTEQKHEDEYDHEHDAEECASFSGRHSQYIKDNIKTIKRQCRQFRVCLNELYSQENLHLILQGGDVDLKLICGFLYPDQNQNQTETPSQCGDKERGAIKEDVQNKFKEALEFDVHHHDEWEEVKECLHNNTDTPMSSSDHLDHICGLALKQEEDICTTRVHHRIQSFLNHQLEHIQCTCNSIKSISPRFPFRYRLAIGGGSLLFLLILIGFIICMCKRKRKRTREKKRIRQETLQRVEYHISRNNMDLPDDPYSVYQEPIYQKGRAAVPVGPPELPPRYTTCPPGGSRDPSLDYLLPSDLPDSSPVPDKTLLMSDRRGLRGPDGASVENINEEKVPSYAPLGPRDDNGYCKASEIRDPPKSDNNSHNYFVLEGDGGPKPSNTTTFSNKL